MGVDARDHSYDLMPDGDRIPGEVLGQAKRAEPGFSASEEKNKRVSFVLLSNFRNFAVSLHITIEIKIQDLSHIHEAALHFIGQIGTQTADAFYGKEVITSPALL